MNRQDVERSVSEYLKPIFGFALKRCKNIHDAEDLSQEIVLKAFRALLAHDDITDMGKFIWTVAHNALNNYYRDSAKSAIGVSLSEIADIAEPCDQLDGDDDTVLLSRLRSEIAYLSAVQRRIVIAYYFENRKQADIAAELDIPLGTVKWHLFEAKKELKRGMDKVRKASDLKFNPIKFKNIGISGAPGTKDTGDFLRSALSQNICYCVRDMAKSVSEIADDLGVSPVYVECEVKFLEEYGFLINQKDRYIANFIISEQTSELLCLRDRMYKKAAKLFANELYDELTSCGILNDPDIWCGQTDKEISLTDSPKADRNFVLWSLIPYIAANSGEKLMDESISFEEVATIRPDGGHNIYYVDVMTEDPKLPANYVHMNAWSGPMWNEEGGHIFWQVDSEWSDRPSPFNSGYFSDVKRVLSLYEREYEDRLSKDEYAWLAELGYVKTNGDYDGLFKASWQIVSLASNSVRDRLLSIGERIKEKHRAEFDALTAPYSEAMLSSVPAHLRKVEKYMLQFLFHSDGMFLLHCITELLNNGKLKAPTEGQRKALTTLIIPRK